MKRFVLLILLAFSFNAYSQDLALPADEHSFYHDMAGKWTFTWEFYSGNGAESIKGRGECENKMILGGRFLESRGEYFMEGGNKEFMQLFGYDRMRKKYTYHSFDEFGTQSVFAMGLINDKELLSFTAQGPDPVSGIINDYEIAVFIANEDKHIISVYTGDGDKSYLTVNLIFDRVKE